MPFAPLCLALALHAAPPAGAPARIEVALTGLAVPGAELIGWDVVLDGAVVAHKAVDGRDPAPADWEGTVAPGRHVLGLRVAYRRALKTIAADEGDRVAFTFVVPGERTVEEHGTFDARPAEVVRLTALVDDSPAEVKDHLVLAGGAGEPVAQADATTVQVGGRSSFRMSAPDDPCLAGDVDRCMLRNFARLFGGAAGAR